jgi:hypothetical protein
MQDKPSANLPGYVGKVDLISDRRNQPWTIVPHVPDGTAHLPSLHFFSRVWPEHINRIRLSNALCSVAAFSGALGL